MLLLPPDAHHEINALQRAADIILQKSTREGFGLTVTEAMWKGKPVIGGAVGGIVLQLRDYKHRLPGQFPGRLRLPHPLFAAPAGDGQAHGQTGQGICPQHFLITRHIRDYLTLMTIVRSPGGRVFEF